MIERTREDLEVENYELRERVEYLEAQVRTMLLSPTYAPAVPDAPAPKVARKVRRRREPTSHTATQYVVVTPSGVQAVEA